MTSTMLAVYAGCLGLALLLTWGVAAIAILHGVVDVPNARSSHKQCTPRGGGLGFVVSFCAASLASGASTEPGRSAWLLIAGIGVAAVGAVDDVRGVQAKTRMLAHLVASLWAVGWSGPIRKLSLGQMELDLGWAGVVLTVLGIAWVINLTNFMDGIDGIASVETMFVCLAAGFLVGPWTEPWIQTLCWLLAAAVAGFLPWNWPPAKIFMGDVGSGFLGYVIAVLMVLSSVKEPHLLWVWLILFGVFVVDASVTLVMRMARRERVWEAHRSHAYQHATQQWGHLRVTLSVAAIDILYLLPCAWLAAEFKDYGLVILSASYVPLVLLALRLGAGGPWRGIQAEQRAV